MVAWSAVASSQSRSQRVSSPGLGRGRAGFPFATRTPNAGEKQRGSRLWLDQPDPPVLFSRVENRLHVHRDVTLGEDRCGVRVPPVAQMLAVLNPLVLSLMDLHQISNVARQIRRFASHPDEALVWLL